MYGLSHADRPYRTLLGVKKRRITLRAIETVGTELTITVQFWSGIQPSLIDSSYRLEMIKLLVRIRNKRVGEKTG